MTPYVMVHRMKPERALSAVLIGGCGPLRTPAGIVAHGKAMTVSRDLRSYALRRRPVSCAPFNNGPAHISLTTTRERTFSVLSTSRLAHCAARIPRCSDERMRRRWRRLGLFLIAKRCFDASIGFPGYAHESNASRDHTGFTAADASGLIGWCATAFGRR